MRATLLLLSLLGCSSPQPVVHETPNAAPIVPGPTSAPSAARPEPPSQPADSRYRVGDYVVYRYDGSALPQPVTLTEQIVSQQGLKLEIAVTAERGSESRSWLQVVTDTAENRNSDKIDKLYLLEGDKRTELPNVDNADVYRLYEWVIPPQGGKLSDKKQTPRSLQVGESSYQGTCTTAKQRIGEREVQLEMCESAPFLWTKVRTTIEDQGDGELIYRMVASEAGRR